MSDSSLERMQEERDNVIKRLRQNLELPDGCTLSFDDGPLHNATDHWATVPLFDETPVVKGSWCAPPQAKYGLFFTRRREFFTHCRDGTWPYGINWDALVAPRLTEGLQRVGSARRLLREAASLTRMAAEALCRDSGGIW